MASAVIHMTVASEINKVLKRDYDKLIIGSIAPDISKIIGETKLRSHFLVTEENNNNIPNIDVFLSAYKKYLYDDFVMGYFIHLYTDYLWFKYFIPEIYDKVSIKKLDGTVIKCTKEMASTYIYNDYTNLNIDLIDKYELNLKIFYGELPKIDPIITEIPMNRLDLLIEKMGLIIKNTKVNKSYVFDLENIDSFIKMSIELTLAKIKEIENEK